MMELLTSPEAWAALLTLTALEIVLGIDNVIFLSVIVSRIPERQAKQARQIGLALALVFRILLLSLLVWLIGLTEPVITVTDLAFSWRDIILIGGGLFLIALTFAPFHVVHPFRVVRLRWLTLWLLGVWAALAIYTIACDFNVGAPIVAGLCAIAAYMVGSDAVIRRIRSFRA